MLEREEERIQDFFLSKELTGVEDGLFVVHPLTEGRLYVHGIFSNCNSCLKTLAITAICMVRAHLYFLRSLCENRYQLDYRLCQVKK